jgi:hypothetical protein
LSKDWNRTSPDGPIQLSVKYTPSRLDVSRQSLDS